MQLKVERATVQDSADIAKVKIASWRSAYAHILPRSTLDALNFDEQSQRFATTIEENSNFWVARQGNEVVGFSAFGGIQHPLEGYTAELRAIYLHPAAFGTGAGRQLLAAGLDELRREGHETLGLFCFAQNTAARAFYAKWGAHFVNASTYEIDGVSYPDAAMGWDSIDELAERLARNEPFPAVRFRSASERDIDILAEIRLKSWLIAYRDILDETFLSTLTTERHIERFKTAFGRGEEVTLVEIRGIPVGFLVVGPAYEVDGEFLDDVGEIRQLYLLPEAQGQGIGSQLMSMGRDRLIQRGFKRGAVWAFEANTGAVRFYQRHGAKIWRREKLELGGRVLDDLQMGWEDVREIGSK